MHGRAMYVNLKIRIWKRSSDNAELQIEKNGRFVNVLKNHPLCSALSNATENGPYAELGIRGIFTPSQVSVKLSVKAVKS
jgi:hypothetical protein